MCVVTPSELRGSDRTQEMDCRTPMLHFNGSARREPGWIEWVGMYYLLLELRKVATRHFRCKMLTTCRKVKNYGNDDLKSNKCGSWNGEESAIRDEARFCSYPQWMFSLIKLSPKAKNKTWYFSIIKNGNGVIVLTFYWLGAKWNALHNCKIFCKITSRTSVLQEYKWALSRNRKYCYFLWQSGDKGRFVPINEK